MIIKAHSRLSKIGQDSRNSTVDRSWVLEMAEAFLPLIEQPEKILSIDLGGISFVTLIDWSTFVSMLERLLNSKVLQEIGINIASDTEHVLLKPSEWMEFRQTGKTRRGLRQSDFEYSTRVYNFVGYLESLGTCDVLNRPERPGKIFYPKLSKEAVDFRSFYTRKDTETRVLDLTRIEKSDHCKLVFR